MLIRIEDKEVEDAAERVRRRRGDKSRTATVALLILDADRGACQNERGDGRLCGAPMGPGVTCCVGCAPFPPKRTRKAAKS